MRQPPSARALIAAIGRQASESGSGFCVRLYGPQDAPDIVKRAEAGVPEDISVCHIIYDMLDNVEAKAKNDDPVICMLCPSPITEKDFSLCLIKPAVEPAIATMTFAVCRECTDLPDLQPRIMQFMREYWPRLPMHRLH